MKRQIQLLCIAAIVLISTASAFADTVNLVTDGKFQDITYTGTGETQQHGYLKSGTASYGALNQWTISNSWAAANTAYYGAVNPQTPNHTLIGGGGQNAKYSSMIAAYGNVMYLQGYKNTSAITATQTITGLEVGKTYYLSGNILSRSNGLNMGFSITGAGGTEMVNWSTSGTSSINGNAFLPVTKSFVATDTMATLSLINNNISGDGSAGFQNVTISETRPDGWNSFTRWTDSTPADPNSVYTHAIHFQSSGGASFNVTDSSTNKTVTFDSINGTAAVAENYFTRTAAKEALNSGVTVSGDISPMGTGFYTMPTGASNSISLKGLLPGFEYETTIFANMWGKTTVRHAYITVNGETPIYVDATSYEGRLDVDDHQGTTLVWKGAASSSGELNFNFDVSSNPYHIHGIANRLISAPKGTLVAAGFSGTNAQLTNKTAKGTPVDTLNAINPNDTWTIRGTNNGDDQLYYTDYNTRSALRLGPNTGARLNLGSAYLTDNQISELKFSVDINLGTLNHGTDRQYARGAGIGFFSSEFGLGRVFVNRGFSGLVVDKDGGIYFYSNMSDGEPANTFAPIAYQGTWDKTAYHTLSFTAELSEDGETATLTEIAFDGSDADYSQLLGKVFQTTDLIGLSSSGSDGYSYFDNFIVTGVQASESAVPEPGSWALLILGALSALCFRRKK